MHDLAVQAAHAAATVESTGRVETLPERIVVAEYAAIERSVAGAGAVIHHRHVLPERPVSGVFHHCLEAPGHVSVLHIGLVDGFEAARGQPLAGNLIGYLVGLGICSPPAFLLQQGH